jgi:hypothetical protein
MRKASTCYVITAVLVAIFGQSSFRARLSEPARINRIFKRLKLKGADMHGVPLLVSSFLHREIATAVLALSMPIYDAIEVYFSLDPGVTGQQFSTPPLAMFAASRARFPTLRLCIAIVR